MICPNCGTELHENAVFCVKCGTRVKQAECICPQCGAVNEPLSLYCLQCGHKLSEQAASPASSPVAPCSSANSVPATAARKQLYLCAFYTGMPRFSLRQEVCNVSLYPDKLVIATLMGGLGRGFLSMGKKRIFEKGQLADCAYADALSGISGAVKLTLKDGTVYSILAPMPGDTFKKACREMAERIRAELCV